MNSSNHIFDKTLLRKRRARTASEFVNSDFLLKRIAEDFNARLSVILRDFPVTLSIGSHHGVVGKKIEKLPNIKTVIYADHCRQLIDHCPQPHIVCDEELIPFAENSLDLVVSALSLQSTNDIPGTLLQIRKTLKPDGLFLCTLFGGRTLYQLREAFAVAESETTGGVSPHVFPFADIRDCGHLLQRAGFALPVTDSDTVTATYKSPIHLLKELRIIGGGNVLLERSRKPLKRGTLMRMAEIYQERFSQSDGRIPATFELITLTGWAPHESQQKPLTPGSAERRLADELGVEEIKTGDKVLPPNQKSESEKK